MPPSPMDQIYAPGGWPHTPLPTGVSIEDLPITSPYCTNDTCRAFRQGFVEDQRRTPLLGLLQYGKWTVWFYSFWILLFASTYLYHQAHDRFAQRRSYSNRRGSSPGNKLVAILRFFAYRRPNNSISRSIGLRQVSYGALSLLAFSTIYIAILPWPQRPYLRALFRFGSPPLSVRCALIISALTPLTVALAGKVNIITWMTGIGYEKLNVFHRYVAYVIFCLATIHTIPHLIAPVRDGGWSMLDVLYADKHRELSGTPLYFTTFGLAFFSIPWIRHRFYEAFKYAHVFLAVSYLGLLWWHTYKEFMSPYYLYASVAVLVLSNIIRLAHRHRNLRSFSTISGFPTSLTHLHGNMTRVVVSVPRSMKWKPGQHVFIRIPGISWTANHPFSIANIPSQRMGADNEMIFLIRRQNGFTKQLFSQAKNASLVADPPNPLPGFKLKKKESIEKDKHGTEHIEDVITVVEKEVASPMSPMSAMSQTSFPLMALPPKTRSSASSFPAADEMTESILRDISHKTGSTHSVRSIVDGPYGTHHRPLHKIYDTVLCIAGGSGITASLPHILDLAYRARNRKSSETFATKRIHLVWVIRDAEWMSWIEYEINAAVSNMREQRGASSCSLTVDIFITRERTLAESPSTSEEELAPASPISKHQELSGAFPGKMLDALDKSEKGDALPLPSKPRPALRRLTGGIGLFDDNFGFSLNSTPAPRQHNASVAMHYCRPVIKDIVESYSGGDRAIVMGCGPPSLSTELANTVAALQRRVWNGEMKELKLDIETFGW